MERIATFQNRNHYYEVVKVNGQLLFRNVRGESWSKVESILRIPQVDRKLKGELRKIVRRLSQG